ncbi:MAG TPA: trypsin-like serine protease [Gaiellaceae bacterium]|nr:trypsin-like serine protease [Gaiellaceae bacterium]
MHRSRAATTFAMLVATLAVLLVAGPAGAVLNGTADTANRFSNVGSLQIKVGADWFQFCSGTLVRSNVVLTAAHCTDFLVDVGEDGFGPDDVRITFDPEQDGPYSTVDRIVVHPDWFTQPGGSGNSKHGFLAPPAEDIALVFLDAPPVGITPAAIAGPGYLAALDLKTTTFTAVGYGLDGFITGSLLSNHPFVLDDGIRSYRDVSVITEHDAFPDRFLKITASVCFGDSGGPLFHNGTVVALNTWTFSTRCTGPNLEYRTDSAAAQRFLAANLP